MMTRRMLLGSTAAGVGALTFSPFTFAAPPLQPQRPADPILEEITRQLQRTLTGLGAASPKGSAGEIAALFRMMSAWAKSANVDAMLTPKVIDEVMALDGGHDAFCKKMAAFDRVRDLRVRGFVPAPTMTNHTAREWAKGIAILKTPGYPSLSVRLRQTAAAIERHANKLNGALGHLNPNNAPVRLIRLRQDDDGCVYNGDGSFTCEFDSNDQPPENHEPSYDDICSELTLSNLINEIGFAVICLVALGACLVGIAFNSIMEWLEWYLGC